MPTYYALLLPQHIRLKINDIRRTLFCKSGDSSFRAQESCILLGETEDKALSKKVTCPPLPLTVQCSTAFSDGTLFFPVLQNELAQIREELGVSHPYSGIYLGKVNVTHEEQLPPLNNLRLAIVEIKEEDGITLWRTLSEKRLKKGR
ncbi:MAG: hypothetical protein WCS35_02300 [Sphaerochaeta sp.]|jgi:hypothetical protein|nr:hypothetical protein [Spirochaetales bacterium]HKM08129.1 hypothetical protein [Sphaerochaeta sp.]